jgi:hypothetical protein
MNPDRLREFEAIASRIIQPILASPRRRRSMREEMLAHLCQAYEEELTRRGDDQAAADSARQRLGDADQLRRQLQASVPYFEHLFCAVFFHKEMVMSRWQWIMGLFASLVGLGFMFGLAIVLPATAKLAHAVDLTQNKDNVLDAAMALKISLMSLLTLAILVALAGIGILVSYAIKAKRRPLL